MEDISKKELIQAELVWLYQRLNKVHTLESETKKLDTDLKSAQKYLKANSIRDVAFNLWFDDAEISKQLVKAEKNYLNKSQDPFKEFLQKDYGHVMSLLVACQGSLDKAKKSVRTSYILMILFVWTIFMPFVCWSDVKTAKKELAKVQKRYDELIERIKPLEEAKQNKQAAAEYAYRYLDTRSFIKDLASEEDLLEVAMVDEKFKKAIDANENNEAKIKANTEIINALKDEIDKYTFDKHLIKNIDVETAKALLLRFATANEFDEKDYINAKVNKVNVDERTLNNALNKMVDDVTHNLDDVLSSKAIFMGNDLLDTFKHTAMEVQDFKENN